MTGRPAADGLRSELAAVSGVDVSRETVDRLVRYAELVATWTRHINLVSASTLQEFWPRHVLDCAQLVRLFPAGARHCVDIGSGGGLPGLVLACVLKDVADAPAITLVESDRRKAAFLATAVRTLDLQAVVRTARAQEVDDIQADIVTARAVASLSDLFSLCQPLASPSACFLLPKGARFAEEVAQARARWHFTLHQEQSITNPDARILVVEDLTHV